MFIYKRYILKIVNRALLVLGRFKKLLVFLVTRPYYAIRTSWPVWYFILNRESVRLYRKYNATVVLSNVQKKIIQDLKDKGLAIVHINELFPEEILFQLEKYFKQLLPTAQSRRGKPFLKELWEMFPLINLDNPFVALALDSRILEIVNSYLGLFSKFRIFTLNVTVPVGVGIEAIKSQRWHRDPEDKKMCKVFLYLNDVDEQAGPFTYVIGSQHGGPWRNIFPQRPPKGFYPPAGSVERKIPKENVKTITGKAGTLVFCDTSGLHKGGLATTKERVMFTACYSSQASLWPVMYRYPENFDRQLVTQHELARYALKNQPSKKAVSDY
ncbi:MAG: phytanoyl-CoA dioxygenase family protein [bacterium]|nr:phytanoyl-CoA dioxygenase family protein [bacterium]